MTQRQLWLEEVMTEGAGLGAMVAGGSMTTTAAVDINDHGVKTAFLVVEQGSDSPATPIDEISVCEMQAG
jgi:hypothetical protein